MSKLYPPGADTKTQNYSSRFRGSIQEPNTLVWHTTEGPGFPSDSVYRQGGTAPNLTARINIAARTMTMRAHHPADRSSRALVNAAGGVQTNTLGAYQVELVGTCDPKYRKTWGGLKAGVDYMYWPDAPDWALELIAQIPAWLHEQWPDFPIKDGAPRGWLAYPSSYGNARGQRMSFSEWNRGRGMVGHQHVPENAHGDPGDLDVAKIVAFALGERPTTTDPDPTPGPINLMDPNLYPPKGPSEGPQIAWLRERISLHLEALGLLDAFEEDDPTQWSKLRVNIQRFQTAQGWSGADADGFVGPVTLARAAADPVTASAEPTPPGVPDELVIGGANLAYYNAAKGSARAIANVPTVAAWLRDLQADALTLTECGAGMLTPLDDALDGQYGRTPGGGKGREIYVGRPASRVAHVASGLGQVATMLDGDDKPWEWAIIRKDGHEYGLLLFHLEHEPGDKADKIRVAQIREAITGADRIFDTHKVDPHRRLYCGDGNSYSWVAAEAARLGKVDAYTVADSTDNAEFKTHNNWQPPVKGGHFDLVLVPNDPRVHVVSWSQHLEHKVLDHHITRTVIRFDN